MTDNFDVLVAGGGPAGSTVALGLARQGYRVALFEATAYSSPRYGETLPPEINPILRGLNLWTAFEALSPLEASGIISVWGDPNPVEVDFVRNIHGPGWHIDRRRFDKMLAKEAMAAGVRVYSQCRARLCRRESDHWSVSGCRARILVDACGSNGLRMDSNDDREIEDVLLAIALTISYSGNGERDLRTSIETTSHGWWYAAPIPNGEMIAMFFTDPVIYRRDGIWIHEQLKAAPVTAARLKGGHIRDSRVMRAASSCRRTVFGNNWLAVGDSASAYDPISGRGVFKALRHATFATNAIASYLRGNVDSMIRYAELVRSEFEEYVRQRSMYYASEHRWLEHAFWRRRAH